MSRGARGDLQVLRSFRAKPASAWEGVPQEVRDHGDAILMKINKIKSFVKNQRTRETKTNSKAQWLTAKDRLREEFAAAERDLLRHMAEMAESRCTLGNEMAECSNLAETLKYKTNLFAHQLKDEVEELRQMAASAKRTWSREEVEMTRDSLYFSRSEAEQLIDSLGEELAVLQADLRDNWPSALGGGLENDPLQGLGHIGELQQLVRKHVDASQAVKSEAIELCQALEARFATRMDEWQEEFTSTTKGIDKASGGWTHEEHSAFVRERAEAVVVVAGGGREAYVRRLAVLFPSRTIKELLEHDEWYIQRKLMLDRRKAIRDAWLRERKELLGNVGKMLAESARVEAMQARTAAEMLERDVAQRQLHSELEALRRQRDAAAAAAADEKAIADQAEAEEAAKVEEHRRLEMEHKKKLISQYREEIKQRQEEEEIARKAEQEEEAKRAAELAMVNRERVDYRAVRYDMKIEDRERKVLDMQHQEDERERRLEQLRAQVAVEAKRDPQRLLQPTAASIAEDPGTTSIFDNGHGYSDDHLFRDQRFKMMTVLAEKGLLQTKEAYSYTNQVLSNAPSLRPVRLDNLTTGQKEAHVMNKIL